MKTDSQDLKWYTGLGIAVLNDLNDVTGFGSKTSSGDLLDAATSAVLLPLIGKKKTAFTLVEFIPGADYFPTYTFLLLWSWKQEKDGAREIEISETGSEKMGAVPVK